MGNRVKSAIVLILVSLSVVLFFQNCADPLPEDESNTASSISGPSCSPEEFAFQGGCVPYKISCPIQNGVGTKDLITAPSLYGMCEAITCNAGYHIDSANQLCVANTIECSPSAGAIGTQTWNGSAYNSCVISSCATGQHLENNQCVSNTQSCQVSNGSGQSEWHGSGYSVCNATSCSAGFHLEGGQCLSDVKTCSIVGGSGNQTWNATSQTYGACENLTCNADYVNKVSSCVGPVITVGRYKPSANQHIFYWATSETVSSKPSGYSYFEGEGYRVFTQASGNDGYERLPLRVCLAGHPLYSANNYIAKTDCPTSAPLLGYVYKNALPGVADRKVWQWNYTSNRNIATADQNEWSPYTMAEPPRIGFVP